MSDFVNTVDVLGEEEYFKQIVERTITEVKDDRVAFVRNSAFRNCSSLTTVDFPNATSLGSYAFSSCSNLTTADFPNATEIGMQTFEYCSSLTTVDFPNATSLGNSAFSSCSNLTTADFPNTTSLETNAFAWCSKLTSVDFPNATSIGKYAFFNCTSLTSVVIGTNKTTVCTLSNASAFDGTPINSGTGYIYVPDNLVDQYKSATRWSTYANQIKGISELPT